MKFPKIILSILGLAIIISACQSVEFKKTSAGVPYKLFSSNKGDSVRAGSIVKYQVIQKVKDSVLYSSYTMKKPEYVQVKPQATKPVYGDSKANAEEIIAKAKAGDSIYLVQSTDSLIKENPQQTMFKSGQQLITTIKIEAVYKTPEDANEAYMKEQRSSYDDRKKEGLKSFKKDTAAQASIERDDKLIEEYLKAHNIQAEKNEWGIYIERLAPGQGPKPAFGQYSTIRYKGMHMSGEVFDQNVMPVQIGVSQVVFGFMEGVSQLSKGEKARIYIPSLLAYGEQGNPPKIQPNENLIFEVEVLDITEKEPAQQQQQPVQQPTGNK